MLGSAKIIASGDAENRDIKLGHGKGPGSRTHEGSESITYPTERLFRRAGLYRTFADSYERIKCSKWGSSTLTEQEHLWSARSSPGDKVRFSHRIFARHDEDVSFASRIRFLGLAEITACTVHCYVILITMSNQACDQFRPVKTCKMRCYRDKRRGRMSFAAIHIMARSHFSFAP